ncbi:MAG: prolidase family protein [Thermoleophilia bacterium]|nr:prolidase family protein [Thermoleophilia bacterium]
MSFSIPAEQTIRPEDLATFRFLVPHEELRRRAAALQARLAAADIDLAIVQSNADVGYVAGSILDGWVLVPASGEVRVLARRAAARVQAETCWPVERMVAVKQLVAELQAMGVDRGRLALALDVVPAADYLKLARALPDAEFVDLTHHLRSVRAVKSEWELANHRIAAEQVKEAMHTVAYQLVPGHTELDAARLAEGCLRGAGHQGIMRMRRFGGEMFFGQVCAAANAALPAALDAPLGGSGLYPPAGKGASTQELRAGDLLVLDLMGCYNGYLSDCTRVVAVGGIDAVDPDLLAAQQWCVETLEAVAATARPGVAPSALYDLALELAADAGHAANFMGVAPDQARFVGHGIGLEVDEYPFLARGFDDPLEAGMVFALEPKLVFPGRAAVGIEDAFIVTEDGVEALPAQPRSVLVAG